MIPINLFSTRSTLPIPFLPATIFIFCRSFAEDNFYKLCVSFAENRDKHISEYANQLNGIAYPTNDDRNEFIKNPSLPLTEEEFIQLNYHEIK